MAGERLAKITIRASWKPSGFFDAYSYQTKEVKLRLDGAWVSFGNDAWSPVAGTPYAVPSPQNDPAYTLTGITNLVAALRTLLSQRKLPYQVSDPRDAGPDPATGWARVDFDVTALNYDPRYDLAFTYATNSGGWQVVENLTTIQPLMATWYGQDATIFGSATGNIQIQVTSSNSGPFTYVWADDQAQHEYRRDQLVAGTYRCIVTDGKGASTVVTALVKSDPRLEVQVTSTDTSITLTPSGGLPPYQYLWDDGSSDRARTGLTAGTYTCLVSDARGAVRQVEVVLSAYSFYWSRNVIPLALDAGADYRLDPTSKPNLSFLCQVWVEKEYLSGIFEQVGVTLEQPADRDGRTTFEVQALLQPFLDYHVPVPASDQVQRATPLFRRFFLQHAEQYGDVPVSAPATSLERSYVLLGGLNFYENQARTWFTRYQPEHKPFLTWEPNRKYVLVDQPEYLYYMVQPGPKAFLVQLRVHFDDGTEQLLTRPGQHEVLPYEVYCLPVGYAALALGQLTAAGRRVSWWEVYLTPPDGLSALTETRRFLLDERNFPFRRYFLFATSLGGMATYAALGEAQTDAEVSGSEAALTLAPDYDPLFGDTAVLERALRPVMKVAAGKRTRAQLVTSQDLLLSRRVLLLQDGRWLPGFVKAKTVTLLDENKLVQTQEFEFALTTERLYTPTL